MTDFRPLAELQERMRDERFVNALRELAQRGLLKANWLTPGCCSAAEC